MTSIPKEKLTEIENFVFMTTIYKSFNKKIKIGYNKQSKVPYVVKIVDKTKIKEKNEANNIINEISILKQLHHQNVISLEKVYEDSKGIYIVMEYCEGKDLYSYVQKKTKLNEDVAAFFYYQIINAIEYIHSKGFSHRNITLDNILISKSHIIKLIGFSSCSSNKLSKYSSPEMLNECANNKYACDIWSSGVVLYTMLCGNFPFDDEDKTTLYRKIIEAKVELPICLSAKSKDLLKQLLVRDYSKRITINEIKRHPFYIRGKELYLKEFVISKKKGKELCRKEEDCKEENLIRNKLMKRKNKQMYIGSRTQRDYYVNTIKIEINDECKHTEEKKWNDKTFSKKPTKDSLRSETSNNSSNSNKCEPLHSNTEISTLAKRLILQNKSSQKQINSISNETHYKTVSTERRSSKHLKYNEMTLSSCSLVAKQENFPLKNYKTSITDCDRISKYTKNRIINKNDLYVNVQKRNKVRVLYNNQSVD